jgi:hypothetical protein
LEFIADRKVLAGGFDKKDYQYHLLKVVGQPRYQLANNFNFSSLKKRIVMMNKLRSARLHLVKFLFILPLLGVLLVAFRSHRNPTVRAIIVPVVRSGVQDTLPAPRRDSLRTVKLDYTPRRDSLRTVKLDYTPRRDSLRTVKLDYTPRRDSLRTVKLDYTPRRDSLRTVKLDYTPRRDSLHRSGRDTVPTEHPHQDVIHFGHWPPGPPPLFLVNGTETDTGFLARVNPQNIESIAVLRDTAAVNKYGEKGRNGVILINLKVPARPKP